MIEPDVRSTEAVLVPEIVVGPGETRVISERTRTARLKIDPEGALVAPEGKHLTLTTDGFETGSRLESTYATTTRVVPTWYEGDLTIDVTDDLDVAMMGETFHLRQAVRIDGGSFRPELSATTPVLGGVLTDTEATDVSLVSAGDTFGGFSIHDSAYTIRGAHLVLDGAGRCDWMGMGAGIAATGEQTRLVVEDSEVHTRGAVRAAVVSTDGAHVVVKNSLVSSRDGELPPDYTWSLSPRMQSVPWVLGLTGTVRTSACMGVGSVLAYINSTMIAENWGIGGTDSIGIDNPVKRANQILITTDLRATGTDCYGVYADFNANSHQLGAHIDDVTYVGILGAGDLTFDDSSPEVLARYDEEFDLRLSDSELASIEARPTVANSTRFGIMSHELFPGGTVTIGGGTVLTTALTTFLMKAVRGTTVVVDGARGATITTGNGVIYQLMPGDDPNIGHMFEADRPWVEPLGPVVADPEWDTSVVHDDDPKASFTDIALTGDFYNGMREGKNLVLSFARSTLEGVISSTTTRHRVPVIRERDFRELGVVDNTVTPTVNNGVIVSLAAGTRWTVTGESHLTRLGIEAGAEVVASSFTVDGVETPLVPGEYVGAIELRP